MDLVISNELDHHIKYHEEGAWVREAAQKPIKLKTCKKRIRNSLNKYYYGNRYTIRFMGSVYSK
jgi:hypothetical protein